MCLRTKTSRSCGHSTKTTRECHSLHCTGIERSHFLKEGECRDCRHAGEATRGREGCTRDLDGDSPYHKTPLPGTTFADRANFGKPPPTLSPWATETRRERESHSSPTRRKADDAWLVEHERRIADLQSRSQSYHSSPRHSPRQHYQQLATVSTTTTASSPPRYFEEPADYDAEVDRLAERMRNIETIDTTNVRRHRHHRPHHTVPRWDRERSHESFESLDSGYGSLPKTKAAPSPRTSLLRGNSYDSGFVRPVHDPYMYAQAPSPPSPMVPLTLPMAHSFTYGSNSPSPYATRLGDGLSAVYHDVRPRHR